MDMQGSRALAVTQQEAWEALNDPEVLKLCIPGCDKLEASGDNQYTVGVAVKIGPVSAKFNGRITLSEVNPPESYTLSFDGQGGAAGFGKGNSQVSLTPAADGAGCVLSYTVQAQVGGKIAQMGQRLIDGVARNMAEDFFKRFDAEMQRRHPGVPAPATVETGAAVAGGSASPAGRQDGMPSWAWVAAALVVAGGAFALWRR